MNADFDRELQILVCAIAPNPAASPFWGVQHRAPGPIDWTQFEALVHRHRVGALVSAASRDLGLPPELATRLGSEEEANASAYLRSIAVLREVDLEFGKVSIDWLLLKGVLLAERFYERPALREMIDIDLLVDQDRIEDAETVLRGLGFERYYPRYDLSAAQRTNFMTIQSAFAFIRKSDGAQLDLHWRTMQNPRFLPVIDNGWKAMTVRDRAAGFPALAEDIHFTYVLAHGAKHGWSRLKWLADVARMLCSRDAAGAELLAASLERHRIGTIAGAAFRLCRSLFGTELPTALAPFAETDAATRNHCWAMKMIAADIPHGGAGFGDLRYLATRVRNSMSLSDHPGFKRQALLRELARPADLEQLPLPAGASGLLAIASPILALGRAIRPGG